MDDRVVIGRDLINGSHAFRHPIYQSYSPQRCRIQGLLANQQFYQIFQPQDVVVVNFSWSESHGHGICNFSRPLIISIYHR